MKTILLITTLLLTTSAHAAMLPGDAKNGKALHDKQCTACHDTGVYTRADRKMKNVEAMIGKVQGCIRQTGANLDAGQANDVIKYLDESFYKFK